MIDRALAGNLDDLNDYIDGVDIPGIVVPTLTAKQWDQALPSWESRDADRGLAEWRSTADKTAWCVPGVCAKAVNIALDLYMKIYAVPLVVEGVMHKGVLRVNEDGVNLFGRFVVTVSLTLFPKHLFKTYLQNTSPKRILCTQVHRGYCKSLNPPVEKHLLVFPNVLKYFLTSYVKLKLLRGVSTALACERCVCTCNKMICVLRSTGPVSASMCRKLG